MSYTSRTLPRAQGAGHGEEAAARVGLEPQGQAHAGAEPEASTAVRAEGHERVRVEPLWARACLAVLLLSTAALYTWNLAASGWANAFYSAAVQAGAHSWTAFFFGSFDSSNFITVDKPPAALWVMDLSARVFGVSPWSILVPEALEGVAAVWLLYATVRRWFSPAAGLIAGAVLATTPVSALMFRFNNPDALLVLLLVASAYAMTRAVESGGTRWLLLAGVLIGLGFLTKMLQAFLVVPPFALTYVLAAPVSLRQRIGQLIGTGVTMLIAAGWWVAAVTLLPAGVRPYIGGSQNNSVLDLIFGYNGFGRLTGHEVGSVGARGAGTGRWGAVGLTRLFNSEMGGQVSWLLPAALLALAAILWMTRRAPWTDRLRAAGLLWGGWLLITGLTFSLAQGIIHPYYTVALAPAIGVLVGVGAERLWADRQLWQNRLLLAGGVAVTAAWAYVLLDRSPTWHPWLRLGVVTLGATAAAGLLVSGTRAPRPAAAALGLVALAAVLVGPTAYAVQTAAMPHAGAIPSAGPALLHHRARHGAGALHLPVWGRTSNVTRRSWAVAMPRPQGGIGARPPMHGGPRKTSAVRAGIGGLLNAAKPDPALVVLLARNAGGFEWVAATVGANNAAGVQLAVDRPVMAIGGFNGTDPAPTLDQFQRLVQQGRIHYFLAGGGFSGPGAGGNSSAAITRWVGTHFTRLTVGNAVVYDVTAPRGA